MSHVREEIASNMTLPVENPVRLRAERPPPRLRQGPVHL